MNVALSMCMNKLFVSLVSTSIVWTASAFAADPPMPATSGTSSATTATVGKPVTPIPATSVSTTTTTTAADSPAIPDGTTHGTQDIPAPETQTWINYPLLLTSTLVLAASYIPMVGVAAESSRPADQDKLYVPVVGPWLNLADRGCAARDCGGNEGLNKALLIADGIGQGLGAIGIVASFFLPNKKTANWYLIGDDKAHAGPTSVGSGYGFGAAGKF